MGSQELNLELQQRITNLTEQAREYIQNKDYQGFEKIQFLKWDILPEPKEKWEESYRISKTLIAFYLRFNIDFEKAKEWLVTLKQLDDLQQQHPGEVIFLTGKIQFEEGLYQESHQSFKKAFVESEGHCFGNGDEKYLEFYRNPEKYLE